MDLLSIVLALLEDHVFEDVEQVVDALAVELGVLVSVGVQVVLGHFLRCFGLKGIACHVNDCHCAHRQVLMPEVQLDKHVRLVICRGVDLAGSFEIRAILLDSL